MKRMPKRFFVALIIAVISVVAIVFYIHSSKYQHTDDAYLESHMVSVAPKVTGQIIEVYIDDNDKVKAGELVAKIDPVDYKIRYEELDAQYEKTLLQQNVAKANLKAANSEIELAKKDLNRYKKLYNITQNCMKPVQFQNKRLIANKQNMIWHLPDKIRRKMTFFQMLKIKLLMQI